MSLFPFSGKSTGQGLVEYALILAGVAVVVIAVLLILGPSIGNVFTKVNSSMAPMGGASPTLLPSATPDWVFCANENGFCSFSGSATVRYGANGSYAYGTYTNGVGCNNGVFGDPNYGVVKACYYRH